MASSASCAEEEKLCELKLELLELLESLEEKVAVFDGAGATRDCALIAPVIRSKATLKKPTRRTTGMKRGVDMS
jgi:hypothetical protein